MVFSQSMIDAVNFAVETHWTHDHQYRKGKDLPYIVHPLTVALVLARAGAGDDLIAAGLLHDTVEDSAEFRKVTVEDIHTKFGERIASLVDSVTEKDKSLSWEERKAAALRHVGEFSHDQVLLKSADVIANDQELLSDYSTGGESVFERFNADRNALLRYKADLIAALREQWPDSPLAGDLKDISGKLPNPDPV